MKKKIKLLLALVMSLTMMLGMSTTAFADEPTQITSVTLDIGGNIRAGDTPSEILSRINIIDSTPNADIELFSRRSGIIKYIESGGIPMSVPVESDEPLEEGVNYELCISLLTTNDYCFKNVDGWGFDGEIVVRNWNWDDLFDDNAKVLDEDGQRLVECEGRCLMTGSYFTLEPGPGNGDNGTPSVPSCDHDFVWQTITAPTATTYGTEGYVCSKCGATKDVRVKSPLGDWVRMQINNAKPGDVLTIDFGPWNSYPLWMMQMIADKPTVTYVFKYTYQGNKYEVTIKPGDKFALDCDWYGPLKMPTLFDTVITKW